MVFYGFITDGASVEIKHSGDEFDFSKLRLRNDKFELTETRLFSDGRVEKEVHQN